MFYTLVNVIYILRETFSFTYLSVFTKISLKKVSLAVRTIDLVGEWWSTKALTICFTRLLLSKFSQFSITSYGALEWGGRDAHLKFCSWDRFLKNYSSRGGVSFISRKLLCTHYSYSANNFWEIISKRICIK